jgi:hypothetical protein
VIVGDIVEAIESMLGVAVEEATDHQLRQAHRESIFIAERRGAFFAWLGRMGLTGLDVLVSPLRRSTVVRGRCATCRAAFSVEIPDRAFLNEDLSALDCVERLISGSHRCELLRGR